MAAPDTGARARTSVAVQQAFARHGRCYGARQLRTEVRAEGYPVGHWRVRRPKPLVGLTGPLAPN